jgi:hypothetical protein
VLQNKKKKEREKERKKNPLVKGFSIFLAALVRTRRQKIGKNTKNIKHLNSTISHPDLLTFLHIPSSRIYILFKFM